MNVKTAVKILENDNLEMVEVNDTAKDNIESLMAAIVAVRGEEDVTIACIRAAFMLGYYYQ